MRMRLLLLVCAVVGAGSGFVGSRGKSMTTRVNGDRTFPGNGFPSAGPTNASVTPTNVTISDNASTQGMSGVSLQDDPFRGPDPGLTPNYCSTPVDQSSKCEA